MKKNIPQYNKDGKLRDLIVELLNTKKNIRKSRDLLTQVHQVINKESIIIQLRNEYNYIERLNEYYKKYYEKIKNLVKEVTKNKNEVETLCNTLKVNFADDVVIVEKYEKKIKVMSLTTDDVEKINEDIMKKKNKETKKLQNKLNDIESKVNLNIKELDNQKSIINRFKNQLEEDKKELIKREKNQLNDYEKLKIKFNYYEKQVKMLKDKIKIIELKNPTKKDVDIENEDLANNLLKKEDKECELNEKIIQNENLHFNVRTLSSEISKLTLKLKAINENNNNNNVTNNTTTINKTIDSKTTTKTKTITRTSPQIIKNKRFIRI